MAKLEQFDAGVEPAKLKELVRQHKVCWETWPEYHIDREGNKIQIGFELELLGVCRTF